MHWRKQSQISQKHFWSTALRAGEAGRIENCAGPLFQIPVHKKFPRKLVVFVAVICEMYGFSPEVG